MFLLSLHCLRLRWTLPAIAVLAVLICHPAFASGTDNELSSKLIKPGFNCAKGHSSNEKMICSDAELARIDHDLMLLYAQAKLATHNSTTFKKTNNEEWLWREQHCHDRACLLQWYANRYTQLANVFSTHKQLAASTSTPTLLPAHASTTIPVATATASSANTSAINDIVSTDLDKPYIPSVTQASTQNISKQLITFPLMANPLLWVVAMGSVVVAFFIWEILGANGQVRKRARFIAAAVKNNIDVLATQQSQWVTGESSGMHEPKRWDKEKRHFIEEKVKPALTDCVPLSMIEVDRLCLVLDYLVWDVQHDKTAYRFRGYLDEANHSDYLHFCVRILKERDWKVRVLRIHKSDAHLVATRKTLIIVGLCKPQSVPVGSESLREAHELQEKYQARKAVVISNAPFTTAVQKEAEKSAALLLHHFDLSLLASMAEL